MSSQDCVEKNALEILKLRGKLRYLDQIQKSMEQANKFTTIANVFYKMENWLKQEMINFKLGRLRYFRNANQIVSDLLLLDMPASYVINFDNYKRAEDKGEALFSQVDECLAKWKAVKPLEKMIVQENAILRMTREDPEVTAKTLNKGTEKAFETKICLATLKEEWEGMKQGIFETFDHCIEQVELMMQEIQLKKHGGGEE